MTGNRFIRKSLILLGLLTLNACGTVTIKDVSATQTAQTQAIGTTVAATLIAPKPYARIIEPQFSDETGLPSVVEVVVEHKEIPRDNYLWVVVRVPKVKPNWLLYPQLQNGIPAQVLGKGKFETTVGLGVEEDSGQPFNIVVLLLDEEANRSFLEYSNNCTADGSKCGGIRLPDTGAEILDFNTVIRE